MRPCIAGCTRSYCRLRAHYRTELADAGPAFADKHTELVSREHTALIKGGGDDAVGN